MPTRRSTHGPPVAVRSAASASNTWPVFRASKGAAIDTSGESSSSTTNIALTTDMSGTDEVPVTSIPSTSASSLSLSTARMRTVPALETAPGPNDRIRFERANS